MATARKTVTVEHVKTLANGMLANSQDAMTAERSGIMTFLERILLDTGNYHGYNHTDGKQGNSDDTRRYYF